MESWHLLESAERRGDGVEFVAVAKALRRALGWRDGPEQAASPNASSVIKRALEYKGVLC